MKIIEQAFAAASKPGEIGEITPPINIAPNNIELGDIIYKIADYLVAIVGSAACLALIIAGIMWALAAGDDEKISQAKRLIKWSIIGLIIALSAWGIVGLVAQIFAPDMTNT